MALSAALVNVAALADGHVDDALDTVSDVVVDTGRRIALTLTAVTVTDATDGTRPCDPLERAATHCRVATYTRNLSLAVGGRSLYSPRTSTSVKPARSSIITSSPQK